MSIKRTTHLVKDSLQRKALTSPLRQEILGRWLDDKPMTVGDIAAGMGRPATALYYHVHELEKVGLLRRVGSRPGSKRDEALFKPIAQEFDLTPDHGRQDQVADSVAALRAAQRMATRDLSAALESGQARFEGPDRNLLAFRMHARLSREDLARANTLLDELMDLFHGARANEDADGIEFLSMTGALAPLRGRDSGGKS